jgi:hypothetical protein
MCSQKTWTKLEAGPREPFWKLRKMCHPGCHTPTVPSGLNVRHPPGSKHLRNINKLRKLDEHIAATDNRIEPDKEG